MFSFVHGKLAITQANVPPRPGVSQPVSDSDADQGEERALGQAGVRLDKTAKSAEMSCSNRKECTSFKKNYIHFRKGD